MLVLYAMSDHMVVIYIYILTTTKLKVYTWVVVYEVAVRLKLNQSGLESITMVKRDDFIAAKEIPNSLRGVVGIDHLFVSSRSRKGSRMLVLFYLW